MGENKVKKVIKTLLLTIVSIIFFSKSIFASTSSTELKTISSTSFIPVIIIAGAFWIMVAYFIIKKHKDKNALKVMIKEEKKEYYENIRKMSREEQFEELSKVVKNILREGYQRNQGNLSKRIAGILQINTCPIRYKTLSAIKKEGYQDVLKSNNPYNLVGFDRFYPDGKVQCIVTPNKAKMTIENANRLNRINTGDDYTGLYPTTYSELIKNNPDIDVAELIKTLESRC